MNALTNFLAGAAAKEVEAQPIYAVVDAHTDEVYADFDTRAEAEAMKSALTRRGEHQWRTRRTN